MRILFLLLTLFSSSTIWAASPLVDSQWLHQHLNDKSMFLLDIRSKESFDYAHIPNSVNSDYSNWRQPQSEVLQKMLPSKAFLESLLSKLGINKQSHIIILSLGQNASDLAAASRVYWTLKQIHHPKVSILNGGLVAWANKKLPLTREPSAINNSSEYFISNIKPQVDSALVLSALDNANTQLIDVRSGEEFNGLVVADDEKAGTIPNAKHLPYQWFTLNSSGTLQSLNNLKIIADSINLDHNKQQIVFCHTAHRAALSWFVLHELLGYQNAVMYDGSTRDWSTQKNLPITQHIPVK